MNFQKTRTLMTGFIAILSLLQGAVSAQDLQKAVNTSEQKNAAARQSQTRVDAVVDQTQSIASDYTSESKVVDGLKVYNTLLQRQINNQMKAMKQLSESMDQVTVVERQVTPLMVRMIEGLDKFIALDAPFLMGERNNRLMKLKSMMDRSDITVAEKFRTVFEAYQIENEYGRTIEAYKGTVDIAGASRQVDFLKVGRVGLYFQSEDAELTGHWDTSAKAWVELATEYRNPIRQGLRIARKQTAPDILMLPVKAAEIAK